ncbi:MAG: ferrochelatase [Bacteroidales bacterium]|nr:ferrochelatase [Bacteroidales bacterium]
MYKNHTAVILVNVGTPDSPTVKGVRRFLTQFLNDPRVITLPPLLRFLLVNTIIIPFRKRKSTKLYQQLWTTKGSPIAVYGKQLIRKLQTKQIADTEFYFAMRYGNPNLKEILEEIQLKKYNSIVILPLFPQYASSTTGTIAEFVLNHVKHWTIIPNLQLITHFFEQNSFIEALSKKIKEENRGHYEHIIFSFHGLPISHITKENKVCKNNDCLCQKKFPNDGFNCYKASCYETARLLAKKLELPESKYTVSFQSRLSKNWLQPFTEDIILENTKKGIKRLMIVAPAFVADCLETTIELGIEYKELFLEYGGTDFKLVDCLNDDNYWVDSIIKIIGKNT